MFEGNAVILKRLQNLSSKPDLRIHHGFLNIDRAESLLSRYPRNHVSRFLTGALHDPGALIRGPVRVADIDGNPLSPHRENRILVEHARAHVGKLPQFPVGYGLYGLGIFNDPGISDQKSRHVRPVLIHVRLHRSGHNRSRDIRSPSGKSLDASVRISSIETGNHRMGQVCKALPQNLIGELRIKLAAVLKTDGLRRIHKFIAEVCRHHDSVQVFSSGGRIVFSGLFLKILCNCLELLLQ